VGSRRLFALGAQDLFHGGDPQWRFIAQRCDPRARLASLPPAAQVPRSRPVVPIAVTSSPSVPVAPQVEEAMPVPGLALAAAPAMQPPLPGIEAPPKKARRREGGGF
jgi:hypothetical protein